MALGDIARAKGVTERGVPSQTLMCMSSSELDTLQTAFREAGGKWSTFVIWAKNTFTLGRSDYQRQYEPILYGWKQGADHYWCGDRDQGDVWFFDKPAKNDLHPTMKPVALVERAIRNSSKSRDIVLDPFGGSGTTLIAAERTGRRARLPDGAACGQANDCEATPGVPHRTAASHDLPFLATRMTFAIGTGRPVGQREVDRARVTRRSDDRLPDSTRGRRRPAPLRKSGIQVEFGKTTGSKRTRLVELRRIEPQQPARRADTADGSDGSDGLARSIENVIPFRES